MKKLGINPMGESPPTTPGERVRVLREAKRMSLSDLALKVGMTPQAIQQFETGKTGQPQPANLRRLASVLDATVDYILEGSKAKTEDEGAESGRIEVFLRQQYRLSEPSIRKIADVVRAVLAEEELEALKERLVRDGVNLSEQP